MTEALVVNEVYVSLQGESTFAGLPCVFVRLTGCNLRCSYCDTAYAFTEGKKMDLSNVLAEIRKLAVPYAQSKSSIRLPLVELTGGEPLLQRNSLRLMKALCDENFVVLIETSGAHDISLIDSRVRRIMDLKCPGSGEVDRNLWSNLGHLKETDEVKFVISTVEDYQWARRMLMQYNLHSVCPVLFSWAAPLAPQQQDKSLKKMPAGQTPISRKDLAEQIVADAVPVRFQVQMHKVIWAPDARGV